MTTLSLTHAKQWLKTSPHPFARGLFNTLKTLMQCSIPAPKWLFKPIFWFYTSLTGLLSWLSRSLFWTPMFKSQCRQTGKGLFLYGGMPYISGSPYISLGHHDRISGHITISGRSQEKRPELIVGDNVDIGWMTTLAVGSQIILEDNVRIAGRAFLAGYPGHPLDNAMRAAGMPDTPDQVGKIHIKNGAWLATGVSVMAGVTIGEGSIIAAGSVVTKDIPDFVVAAGSPAKVVKQLTPSAACSPKS
ncbi:acyltransferase [Motilimonas eburnea]|uniref:acyltransferase n=1 Tax=Motilimonas eburnea TaxID=1737488 RepID=UPI001E45F9BB|nr:acyltransferase [Motilimonas eburnea]MCE2570750.1 acyltransferase [Motilimonas eburnea]